MNSVGQYTMVSRDRTLKFGSRSFRVVLYGAYNAMGLVGPENNGIAVLDEDRMQVVIDAHLQEDTGYFGPSDVQVAEWERICAMDAPSFKEFCDSHPSSRESLDLASKANPKPRFNLQRYISIATSPVAYNESAKREFLRTSKQMAILLASRLGLNEDQYEVRVNKGGIAVSGEVILHTDSRYVRLSQSSGILGEGFLVRTCEGRGDFVGGRNHFVKWEDLRDLEGVCEFIHGLAK